MAYNFDQSQTSRLRPIPISKTREYKATPNGSPSKEGAQNYYRDILQNKLAGKAITRFVLVDHSTTGGSVNGARRAILEIIKAAADRQIYDHFKTLPWGLINLVDAGTTQITDPDADKIMVMARLRIGNPGELNRLVGDRQVHDRVEVEYYPLRWEKTVGYWWGVDGGKPQAVSLRRQIADNARANNNGQLLPSI